MVRPRPVGPYQMHGMHGKWSLHLDKERRRATFSAQMTVEAADFANTDPNHDPTKLGPHPHDICVAACRASMASMKRTFIVFPELVLVFRVPK